MNPTIIVAAEALVDIHHSSSNISDRGKASDKGEKEGRDNDSRDIRVPSGSMKESSSSKKFGGYFICDGPHMVRDCRRKEKLSALTYKSG